MDTVEQKVYSFIVKNNLVKNQKLLVAVSGGPDSVCLLNVLHNLCRDLDLTLYVVHLDHRLRGEESEADARYVGELSRQLDIPAFIESRDVASYQLEHRLSPEEAAREVRYAVISGVAESLGIRRVAVGHTLDDNIETVLMHLIRGSGTLGLTGLRPSSSRQIGKYRIEIVRPLLEIGRYETQAYCAKHNLSVRIDSSNQSLSPLRNKIRLQLLPLLKTYNTDIAGALLRTARIAADEFDTLSALGEKAWKRTVKLVKNTAVIDKAKFNLLDPALQRLLVRRALETLRSGAPDPLKDIESVHIDAVLEAARKPAGKFVRLPYGLTFTVEYDKFLLGADPAVLSPFPPFSGDFPVAIPGITSAGPWTVITRIIRPEQMGKADRFTAYLDFDRVSGKLNLASCQTGDRFQPLGLPQMKKVSRFLIDSRVPHAWRDRIPVLRSDDMILWISCYRIDDRVKVTGETKNVLKVRLKKGC